MTSGARRLAECAALAALPAGEQLAGFYRCWTRKEAFVKAHGAGLSVPLHGFDVSLDVEDGQHLLKRLDQDIGLLSDWALLNIDVVEGFHGALAVLSAGRNVVVHYRSRSAWSWWRSGKANSSSRPSRVVSTCLAMAL